MGETTLMFEDDGEIRRKVWVTYDETGRPLRAYIEQEVDPILEQNARTREFNDGRKWGDYKPAASIPLTMFEKLGMQAAVDARDRKYISKVLNDSDYEKFRTSSGKV